MMTVSFHTSLATREREEVGMENDAMTKLTSFAEKSFPPTTRRWFTDKARMERDKRQTTVEKLTSVCYGSLCHSSLIVCRT